MALRKQFFLFCVLLILAAPASGKGLKHQCRTIVQKLSQILEKNQKPILVSSGPIKNAQELLNELEPEVKQWLEVHRGNYLFSSPRHKGEIIQVGNVQAQILEVLGGGREGQVFLVKVRNELQALKTFNSRQAMNRNLGSLREYKDTRFKIPSVLKEDQKNAMVLFSYESGVPLDQIFTHWKQLGISQNEAQAVRNQFEQEIKAFKRRDHLTPLVQNVIYLFKEKKFCIVDPY